MKNKLIFYLLIFILQFFNIINSHAVDDFNFNVTEIEISENGNVYKGINKGTVSSNNGIIINADEFEYRKNTNELKATGNVEVIDKSSNDQIFSNSIIYLKNKEIIYSEGNSKALVNDIVVKGDIFEFDKNKDKFIFKNNVRIDDTLNNNTIFSNHIIYEKNDESFFSKGPTEAIINKKYNFNSSDVFYLNNELKIYSNEESEIKDKFNHYSLSKFNYDILKKELIGEKILILTDYKLPKSDKYFFDSGFFNLEENQFIAQNVKILLHPTLFGGTENNQNKRNFLK